MSINKFRFNSGTADNPQKISIDKFTFLEKNAYKDEETEITTDLSIDGHIKVINDCGEDYDNNTIYSKNLSDKLNKYGNSTLHGTKATVTMKGIVNTFSFNKYYNFGPLYDSEKEKAKGNTSIVADSSVNLALNSNIGIKGLNIVKDKSYALFDRSFKQDWITPGNPNFNPITWIVANTHVYVGKYEDGNMKLMQLSDEDGTKFADGSDASAYIEDTDYNVFVKFPSFWYNCVINEDNAQSKYFDPENVITGFNVSLTEPNDGNIWNYWDTNKLIGKYYGSLYTDNGVNKLSSLANKNVLILNYDANGVDNYDVHQLASNVGDGFCEMDYDSFTMTRFLIRCFYGNFNFKQRGDQQIDFVSSSMVKTGGTKNLGMMDSVGLTTTMVSQIDNGSYPNTSDTSKLYWINYNKNKKNYFCSNDYTNRKYFINIFGIEGLGGELISRAKEFRASNSTSDAINLPDYYQDIELMMTYLSYHQSKNKCVAYTCKTAFASKRFTYSYGIAVYDKNNKIIRIITNSPSHNAVYPNMSIMFTPYGDCVPVSFRDVSRSAGNQVYDIKWDKFSLESNAYTYYREIGSGNEQNELVAGYFGKDMYLSAVRCGMCQLLHQKVRSSKYLSRLMYEGPQEIVEDFDS